MTFDNGRYINETKEEILSRLVDDAVQEWGDSVRQKDRNAVRTFYEPIAERFAELQADLRNILDGAQLRHAQGAALDMLTSNIGVNRKPPLKATGSVTFSRNTDATQDYLIPEGTQVQTQGLDPVEFETTTEATLSSGTQSVTVDVIAQSPGSRSNVGSGTLVITPAAITGVQEVTNNNATSGGRDRESDESLRNRANEELGEGSRASTYALYTALNNQEFVSTTSIITSNQDSNVNSVSSTGFEAIVDHDSGREDDVAQVLFETMAGGATPVSGVNGTATSGTASLPNGQTFTIDYSVPTIIDLNVEVDLETTEEFEGNYAVVNAIVEYIGGEKTTNTIVPGDIGVGDDVIYGEVEYAIRSVKGVYDINNLEIGTGDPPTGTSNISVANSEKAELNAPNVFIAPDTA